MGRFCGDQLGARPHDQVFGDKRDNEHLQRLQGPRGPQYPTLPDVHSQSIRRRKRIHSAYDLRTWSRHGEDGQAAWPFVSAAAGFPERAAGGRNPTGVDSNVEASTVTRVCLGGWAGPPVFWWIFF